MTRPARSDSTPAERLTIVRENHNDELVLLVRVEAIARHLRGIGHAAEAVAVENLGTLIEGYAEHWRPWYWRA